MRKSKTLDIGQYKIIVYQMLFDQFLVASGHITNLLSGAIKDVLSGSNAGKNSKKSKGTKIDLGQIKVEDVLERIFSEIKPADLPVIMRDLMAGVVMIGPDPLQGGNIINGLSDASKNEIFGEFPEMAFQIVAEVVKLNSGFLTKIGKLWSSLSDGQEKTSTDLSAPSGT